MKRMPPWQVVVAGILVIASLAIAQQGGIVLKIEQVMTPEELRATGISSLTPPQRAALDQWLNKYTQRILLVTQNLGTAYSGIGGHHWVKQNADGKLITLEDGSLWEINSIDTIDTALWLPISNITVIQSRSPTGDYKYELINTDDGEKALAKYIGK